jgi:hypothetical protein
MQSYKRIYEKMITEGTDKFDIALYINGDLLMVQNNTDKKGFEMTLKSTIKNFGKENVESKFGPKGYIKAVIVSDK